MDLDEGATRDRDPEKIAVSGALCACSGAACHARGERKRWGQRVSERERGRGDRATDRERVRARWGRPARCRWAAPGPLVGCARRWLGRLAWLAPEAFPFFLKQREGKILKKIYIYFIGHICIYIKILRGINPTTWTFFQR